jgi:hypothetical protein
MKFRGVEEGVRKEKYFKSRQIGEMEPINRFHSLKRTTLAAEEKVAMLLLAEIFL